MYIEASAHAFALYTQDSPMNTEISSLVVGPDAYEHTGMRIWASFLHFKCLIQKLHVCAQIVLENTPNLSSMQECMHMHTCKS